MRFKKTREDYEDELDERFTSPANRKSHYEKHFKTKEEQKKVGGSEENYEKMADELAKSPVDHKKIFGYMSKKEDKNHPGVMKTFYYKYNKETELFVMYYYSFYGGNEPLITTAFLCSWRDYNIKKAVNYMDEIPEGK